jgi:hypothetical protein
MALLAVTTAPEPKSKPCRALTIQVRVYDFAQLPRETLKRAEDVTASILRYAGVESAWHKCAISAGAPAADFECRKPRTATDLVVKILTRKMVKGLANDPDVYGIAFRAGNGGFASHASVFYHQIDALSRRKKFSCSVLLGTFLAHEIGHLLLGPDSHSKTGIMRVPFDKMQVQQALWGILLFTPSEGARIRSEVLKRMEACAGESCRPVTDCELPRH